MTAPTDIVTATRDIPGVGRLDFQQTEKRREYWLLPEGGQRRSRLPSVTTILRDTWPKPALLQWYAREGANASTALEAASQRGKAVHRFIETYATTGNLLDFADFPQDYWPYLRGAATFLWTYDIKPLAVELLVCHPELRFAGRLDLIAELADAPGVPTLVDFKTNPKGAIYNEAHVQCAGYRMANERCDGLEIQRVVLVGIGEDAGLNIVEGNDHEARKVWGCALDWYGQLKRLEKALA